MISQKEALALFYFDVQTGRLWWRKSGKGRKLYQPAGYTAFGGYRTIRVYGVYYYGAHQLIWLMRKGYLPKNDIDHRDGDPSNNRWKNLREATRSQNNYNAKLRIDNVSGFKGVCWNKQFKKWMATIKLPKKRKYLGLFSTPQAAGAAYVKAAKKHFGEFARAS